MGKIVKRSRRRQKRSMVAVIALMLVLLVSTGVTAAFLIDKTQAVTNVFEAGTTDITVDEDFDNTTKTDVKVTNNGTVPVYVRVALIPTWLDDNDNTVPVAASLSDLDITWSESTNWVKSTVDGFWYYKVPVNAKTATDILIEEAVVVTNNDYRMNLQVMAQSIQSEPDAAVLQAWASGVSSVSDTNVLTIKQKTN